MSQQLAQAEESAADERLLDLARAGDPEAFEELYREHVDSARRLAVILVGRDNADELVAEAFARVLAQLKAGRGPQSNFRSYLHVTIRNGFRDMLRSGRETPASDQPWLLDEEQPPAEELVDDIERDAAVAALTSLPQTWQQVLWHVEVEGRKPAEVASILDMRPAAVSSLAYRAREGLRRAYLDQHVGPAPAHNDCRWTRDRLSQYVRGDLGQRAEHKLDHHVKGCGDCGAAFLQLERLNKKLAAYVLPVVLVGAVGSDKVALLLFGAAGASGAAGAAGTTGTPPSGGSGPGPVVAGAAAVAAVAALAAGGFALTVGDNDGDGGGDGRQAAAPGAGPADDAAPPADRRPAPPASSRPAPPPTKPDLAPPADDAPPSAATQDRPADAPPADAPPADAPPADAPPTDAPPTDRPPVEPPPTDPPPTDPPPVDNPADNGLPGKGPRADGPPGKGPDGNGPPAHGVQDAAPEGHGPKVRGPKAKGPEGR